MICVLCRPQDQHALWLALQLRARGLRVEIVLPEELLIESYLSLRLSTAATEYSLRLARGVVIDARCQGVVNRLDGSPPLRGSADGSADAAYLNEEGRAAIAAWLMALTCPVLNRPSGAWLGGPIASELRWRWLAQQLGLPIQPWAAGLSDGETPRGTRRVPVFVVSGQVIDPEEILSETGQRCVARVVAVGGLEMAAAEFALGLDAPRLVRVHPLPPLAEGGDPLVSAVEHALPPI